MPIAKRKVRDRMSDSEKPKQSPPTKRQRFNQRPGRQAIVRIPVDGLPAPVEVVIVRVDQQTGTVELEILWGRRSAIVPRSMPKLDVPNPEEEPDRQTALLGGPYGLLTPVVMSSRSEGRQCATKWTSEKLLSKGRNTRLQSRLAKIRTASRRLLLQAFRLRLRSPCWNIAELRGKA
jgi:hypothetical protein